MKQAEFDPEKALARVTQDRKDCCVKRMKIEHQVLKVTVSYVKLSFFEYNAQSIY